MKTQLRLLKNIVVVVLFAVATSSSSSSTAGPPVSHMPDNMGWFPFHEEAYELGLGIHQEGSAKTGNPILSAQIHVPGAPWLRLFFGDHHLGEASYLTITSTKDNARQHLTAKSLAQSGNASAFFNGDMVTLELHSGRGRRGCISSRSKRFWSVNRWVRGFTLTEGCPQPLFVELTAASPRAMIA